MNNINELIERAHSQAKEAGWWDKPRNTGELHMLIVSECGEALEAHRSGKFSKNDMFESDWTLLCNNPSDGEDLPDEDGFKISFQRHIKDTFEDELADIVIRIADWLGHCEYKATNETFEKVSRAPMNVGDALWKTTKAIALEMDITCEWAIASVFAIADDHGIDLWRHIELKLAYNRTRPRKHGKAY
jgi:hypothetical protein